MDRNFRNSPINLFRIPKQWEYVDRAIYTYTDDTCTCSPMRVCTYAQETHAFNSHAHKYIREHKCVSNFARDRRSLAECRLLPTSQRFSRAARRQLDQNRVATTDEKSCYHLKTNNDAERLESDHRSEKPWLSSEGLSLTSVCTSPLLSRTAHQRVAGFLAREHLEQQVFRSPLGRLGILPLSQANRERQSPPGSPFPVGWIWWLERARTKNLHLSSTWKLPISQDCRAEPS